MKYLLICLIILFPQLVHASSCCGGGSSSSMIITGDNRQEWNLGVSYRNDLGQTDNFGWATFHDDKIKDHQNAINFQYQRQLYEQFQLAAKTSLIQKTLQKQGRSETRNGLGDLDLQASFEFLPEYTYSLLKPRGFIYSKLTIPNSRSLYDSNSAVFSDVRGSGLYSLSLGTFFLKKIASSSFKIGLEGQHLFGRTFNQNHLSDYNKLIIPLGYTYAFDPTPLSIGFNSTWNYQTEKKLTGEITSISSKEYFWELGTFLNWSINREETWGVSYSDSTLVGKNINSPLYRTFGLNYTHATEL